MKRLKICLLFQPRIVPATFTKSMYDLCEQLKGLGSDRVVLLETSRMKETSGKKFDGTAFSHDLQVITEADLLVVMWEYASITIPMLVFARCMPPCRPMLLFCRVGLPTPVGIVECIKHFREARFGGEEYKAKALPDPILFETYEEIFVRVKEELAKWQ